MITPLILTLVVLACVWILLRHQKGIERAGQIHSPRISSHRLSRAEIEREMWGADNPKGTIRRTE